MCTPWHQDTLCIFTLVRDTEGGALGSPPPPPPPPLPHTHWGHTHLAEPGCLCTKQALGACASKLLENGLGTLAGGPATFSQQVVWAPEVPPGPLLLSEEPWFSPQLTPGTHSQLGGLVGVVGDRGRRMVNVYLRVVGLEPMTHGSWAHDPNHFTTRPPPPPPPPHTHTHTQCIRCFLLTRSNFLYS